MLEITSDNHYEEKFEFPLWRMIKKIAEDKDISYAEACWEAVAEYQKTIKYKGTGSSNEQVR